MVEHATLPDRLYSASKTDKDHGAKRLISLGDAIFILKEYSRKLRVVETPVKNDKEAKFEHQMQIKLCKTIAKKITGSGPSIVSKVKALPVKNIKGEKHVELEGVLGAINFITPFMKRKKREYCIKANHEHYENGELGGAYWSLSDIVDLIHKDMTNKHSIPKLYTMNQKVLAASFLIVFMYVMAALYFLVTTPTVALSLFLVAVAVLFYISVERKQ